MPLFLTSSSIHFLPCIWVWFVGQESKQRHIYCAEKSRPFLPGSPLPALRGSQTSREMQSLQHDLGMSQGLLLVGHAQNTLPKSWSRGIPVRCPNPLNWHFSIRMSSGSILNTSKITKDVTVSQTPFEEAQFHCLQSWSLCSGHYTELVAIDTGRDVHWPVNQMLHFQALLSRHPNRRKYRNYINADAAFSICQSPALR